MYTKKKALVLVLSDPSGDPRPRRTIELLNDMGFLVDTVSFKILGSLNVNRSFELTTNANSRIFALIRRVFIVCGALFSNLFSINSAKDALVSFWFRLGLVRRTLKDNEYNLLVVEDLFFLPLVLKYKGSAKIIFDAREYYPRQWEHNLIFRLVDQPIRRYLCNRYLPLCDEVLTVSYGLAEEYFKEFGVKCHLVRSTPDANIGSVVKTLENHIKLVHHGLASRNRKLENMIYLVEMLDSRFTLDMYLQGDKAYVNELKVLVGKNERIKILPPVEFSEIVPMLRKYDIGLFYVEPTTFNLAHCLPNKLFEFIQAGIGVAIGPSPDMARVLREYQCGLVSDSFDLDNTSRCLNGLSSGDVDLLKINSIEAAKTLNWQEESKALRYIIDGLLEN